MKSIIFLFVLIYPFFPVFSQQNDPVLMKINGIEIPLSQFQSQYNQNKGTMSLDEYLILFIDDQLKISEAKVLGLDTTADFVSRLRAYRRQMAKSYFNHTAEKKGKAFIKGLHIYKYLPQNTSFVQVKRVEQQMDSLHKVIQANPSVDFVALVQTYSHDKDTFFVGRLEMPEEFEKVAFQLEEGQVSAPFVTPQGIHIVKVLNKGIIHAETIRRPISGLQDDESFLNKIKTESRYTPNQAAFDELLDKGETKQTLFTMDNRSYTGDDFAYFSRDNTKSLDVRINDFIRKSLYSYEDNRLDSIYPAFRNAVQAYSDTLLLSHINSRSNIYTDEELEAFFSRHKKQYRWELPRYKGLVIHTKDKKTRKNIKKQLRKISEKDRMAFLQREYTHGTSGSVIAEQGIFAVAQNAFVDKMVFKVGSCTPLESHPFTLLVGKKVKGPETYEEIREAVISDYQNDREERWLSRLRQKSKVEINEEVIKTVN